MNVFHDDRMVGHQVDSAALTRETGINSAKRRGVLLMLSAIAMLGTMDLLTKITSRELGTIQIAWGRYSVQLFALLIVSGRTGITSLTHCRCLSLHLFRAGLLLTGNIAFITGLRFLSLAEANVIGFASPLLLTALVSPVLGERVRCWVAVWCGLAVFAL